MKNTNDTRLWTITKQFDFCYGHSVYTQSLNVEYSLDDKCVCRHLHGHQGTVLVSMRSTKLDKRGFVCDFKELNWFKKWVDDTLDHKMIIDLNDPGISYIVPIWEKVQAHLKDIGHGAKIVNPDYFKTLTDTRLIELLEGFVFVEFVPTSENLSAWMFSIVDAKMSKIGVITDSIQFFETPKSQSVFTGDSICS